MKKFDAFSLVELSIALLVLGIIVGSVFKGVQLVETAKVQSVVRQFQELRSNLEQYLASHGKLPGDTSQYSAFENTEEAYKALHEAGLMASPNVLKSKFGGVFKFETIGGSHFISLMAGPDSEDGVLSAKQAREIKNLLNDTQTDLAEEGDLKVRGCARDGHIPEKSDTPCVISYKFSG